MHVLWLIVIAITLSRGAWANMHRDIKREDELLLKSSTHPHPPVIEIPPPFADASQAVGSVNMSSGGIDDVGQAPPSASFSALAGMVPDRDEDDDDQEETAKSSSQDNQKGKIFNFASHTAGAVVLGHSPAAKGFYNLLDDDMDRYGISPCNEKKWVVIGLSEDILITSVVIANFEKYSSFLKDFQLLASTIYPTEGWINLGSYTALPRLGEQIFNVTQTSTHCRYVKFKFLSHYDSESLCTLSQIKVHGTTAIASFKEEVEMSDNHMRSMLNTLTDETQEAAAEGSNSTVGSQEYSEDAQVQARNATADGNISILAFTAETVSGDGTSVPLNNIRVDSLIVSASTRADGTSADGAADGASHSNAEGSTDDFTASEAVGSLLIDKTNDMEGHQDKAGDGDDKVVFAAVKKEKENEASSNIGTRIESVVRSVKEIVSPLLTQLTDLTDAKTAAKDLKEKGHLLSDASADGGSVAATIGEGSMAAEASGHAFTEPALEATAEVAVAAQATAEIPSSLSIRVEDKGSEPRGGGSSMLTAGDTAEPVASLEGSAAPIADASAATAVAASALSSESARQEVALGVVCGPSDAASLLLSLPPSAEDGGMSTYGTLQLNSTTTEQPQLYQTYLGGSALVEVNVTALTVLRPIGSEREYGDAIEGVDPNNSTQASVIEEGTIISRQIIVVPVAEPNTSSISTACLDIMRFPDFQAKMMAKLQQKEDRALPMGGSQNENVYKRLMTKVNALEKNHTILVLYMSQVSECYRSLIVGKLESQQRHANKTDTEVRTVSDTKRSERWVLFLSLAALVTSVVAIVMCSALVCLVVKNNPAALVVSPDLFLFSPAKSKSAGAESLDDGPLRSRGRDAHNRAGSSGRTRKIIRARS